MNFLVLIENAGFLRACHIYISARVEISYFYCTRQCGACFARPTIVTKSQETTFFCGRQKLTSAMKLRP